MPDPTALALVDAALRGALLVLLLMLGVLARRRLINQCLGHRSFSACVNGWRLAEPGPRWPTRPSPMQGFKPASTPLRALAR